MSRSRRFCFTLNNYSTDELEALQTLQERNKGRVSYVLYSQEVGESGTPHIQGYLEFNNPVSAMSVVKMFNNRAHVEISKGSFKQNFDYIVSKSDLWLHFY